MKTSSLRPLAYLWALPVTLVGLVAVGAALLTGGGVAVRDGVIEAHGGNLARWLRRGRFRRGGAAATLGHVVLARDAECLARSRTHERVHVRQFERWGPLLLPAAWLVALRLRATGRDPDLDHPFEPPPE